MKIKIFCILGFTQLLHRVDAVRINNDHRVEIIAAEIESKFISADDVKGFLNKTVQQVINKPPDSAKNNIDLAPEKQNMTFEANEKNNSGSSIYINGQ